MSVTFLDEPFSGSGQVTASTPTIGGAWSSAKVDQTISDVTSSEVTAGVLRSKATNYWFGAINAAVPPSANYDVEAALSFLSPSTTNGNLVIAARWDEAGFGTGYYVICWRNSSGNIQGFLRRRNGGGANDDSWAFPGGVAIGNDFTVKLSCTATQIIVYVDGVAQITQTETNVSQVGKVALHIDSDSSGYANVYIRSITATDPTAVPDSQFWTEYVKSTEVVS